MGPDISALDSSHRCVQPTLWFSCLAAPCCLTFLNWNLNTTRSFLSFLKFQVSVMSCSTSRRARQRPENTPKAPRAPRVGRLLSDGEAWMNNYNRFCATAVASGTGSVPSVSWTDTRVGVWRGGVFVSKWQMSGVINGLHSGRVCAWRGVEMSSCPPSHDKRRQREARLPPPPPLEVAHIT